MPKEWFAAFDPGKINFAFIIEEIDTDILKKCICPPKSERFIDKSKNKDDDNKDKSKDKGKKKERNKKKKREDLEPSDAYLSFLEKFYHCGKTILCANTDITKELILSGEEPSQIEQEIVENIENIENIEIEEIKEEISLTKKKRRTKEEIQADKERKEKEKKEREEDRKRKKEEREKEKEELKKARKRGSKALDKYIFLRLTELLDSYKSYFDKCTTIIIEQQMSFGTRVNTMAIKIAQHVYSYFLFRYGDQKTIVEFPSYNKTQILGAPGGMEKPKRKKWAVEKADEIWTLRGDIETASMVGSKRKKDDMSDCLLHVLSYIILKKYG